MLNAIKKCWSPGVAGSPVRRRRQIELCNQAGLFGTLATIPYQVFYFFYDLELYCGIFIANLFFMAAYLLPLLLNYRRQYAAAKKLLLVNACVQIFFVTFYIGAGAGVHLFYFTLASILVFMFQKLNGWAYIAGMALFGALYITAHFLFPPALAYAPVPKPWVDIMYGGSVANVLALLGVLLYLCRQQIDTVENKLMLKNQYLETLSNTDPLTGLANRRVLDEALEREWGRLARQPDALSVIMCDVDHFKRFNDHYGHDGGDHCLQRVTETLKGVTSRPSDLVARYGGEEFAFVLPGTDEQGARHLGENVCEAVRELNIPHAGASKGFVTISVGVSSIDPSALPDIHPGGGAHLLKCADKALYQAKTNGRDQAVFLPHPCTDTQ